MGHGHGHHHDHAVTDRVTWDSADGLRAVKIASAGLALTATVEFAIAGIGHSVALLADGLHNLGDVLTTVALWLAFLASRRAADSRYTFGYERFEDLAGAGVVLIIAVSALVAGYQSYHAMFHARHIAALGASVAAAAVGIIGNEAVAEYKLRVGRRIHSVALEADGIHSRVDGFVSGAALVGLLGVAMGYPKADPIAAAGITVVIAWVTVGAARSAIGRVVDAVDPALQGQILAAAQAVEGVHDVHDVAARWAGRSLMVQLHIGVDGDAPLRSAHDVGEQVRHAIAHEVPGIARVVVHFDPWPPAPGGDHGATAHHFAPAQRSDDAGGGADPPDHRHAHSPHVHDEDRGIKGAHHHHHD
ncbi:MAG TPA: cation diffusion facilitator family transporter [Actinomycetota bacterium]|nr:cation diffusion facilitator family transporter [Actinomycetota bacterium]